MTCPLDCSPGRFTLPILQETYRYLPRLTVRSVKSHSQLKLIGLQDLLMRFAAHPVYRDPSRFSRPA